MSGRRPPTRCSTAWSTQPKSIDIADMEYLADQDCRAAGRDCRRVEIAKIKDWDKLSPLFTEGKFPDEPKCRARATAPIEVSTVDEHGRQDLRHRARPTGRPASRRVYNADTLGIRPDLVGRPIDTWADLLNPEFKGKAVDPEHPVDRHHGRRHGLEARGRDQVRRQGQHDQGRDRQDHRHPDRGQEGRPVPRVLEDLRREREPDGLGRGGDPVDVVAGRHRRRARRASPASTSR